MKRFVAVLGALVLGIVVVGPPGALAGNPLLPKTDPDGETTPQDIKQDQPSFLVAADVNHTTRSYREGDNLSIRVVSEEDAYLYVLYQQADNKVFQIFPNKFQPNNKVGARQTVQVPAQGDLFRWAIGPPFGVERIKVIASKQPLEALADASFRAARFNPVGQKDLKGIEIEIGEEEPAQWAEHLIEIETHARDAQQAASGAKRFGVFFGIAEYQFNDIIRAATDGKSKLNLQASAHDARAIRDLLAEVGQLGENKVFTNADATREVMEFAITQYLPSVSRPGDTVVIYFSGHGGQIPDDNGDEPDGLDEFLVTHDYTNVTAVAAMKAMRDAGQLPDGLSNYLDAALSVIQKAGSIDKGNEALTRLTSVTDDLFAHWLQRLSGRQVIVIIDACHSGGLSGQEKSFAADGSVKFDFLDGEVGRLKDIGQKETAMLAACKSEEVALERFDRTLSVLTHSLIDVLHNSNGSVAIEAAHKGADERVRQYIEEVNREIAGEGVQLQLFHPVLLNLCSGPVLLKP